MPSFLFKVNEVRFLSKNKVEKCNTKKNPSFNINLQFGPLGNSVWRSSWGWRKYFFFFYINIIYFPISKKEKEKEKEKRKQNNIYYELQVVDNNNALN